MNETGTLDSSLEENWYKMKVVGTLAECNGKRCSYKVILGAYQSAEQKRTIVLADM